MISRDEYDVVVIGGGHAGIEAGVAAARLGCKACLFSISLESIANLPCNPSIGGTAKGQLVREVDALGGVMGELADRACLEFRMLNQSKGYAARSPRAQVDKNQYKILAKQMLERQQNLHVRQAEIVDIILDAHGAVNSVITATGIEFLCKTVIIATGTFLRSRVIIGSYAKESGPDGCFSASFLSRNLQKIGVKLTRFKTGTPARVNRCSIDFSRLEPQFGDTETLPFSFRTRVVPQNKTHCHITYTNENTHNIIRKNLDKSPLYSGIIEGVGPRYCPSIEDKVVKFSDKPRHQLFIEPMGENTDEMYLQGLSTSLPEDVQIEMIRSIAGLEHAQIMRSAYAIEYDCCDPLQLKSTLEFKNIPGLFGAGQFCGTSGYEEAAAQGLIAGINAARKAQNKQEFTISRADAYIGVLIDDLVTKGASEPYRMMTSRAEFRLLLRHDNADARLMPLGFELGLIAPDVFEHYLLKKKNVEIELKRLQTAAIPASAELEKFMRHIGARKIFGGIKSLELLKRPEVTYADIQKIDPAAPCLEKFAAEQVEISVKYKGYLKKQSAQVARQKKFESTKLSPEIDYEKIKGLRLEAAQKLSVVKPETIGQAARISGVNPADISVLLIFLKIWRAQNF
jgi:tRNA uridine 5-carboxymethylaminomethyl modification enzyme